jgi:iron complex transport system ATP-binding protein
VSIEVRGLSFGYKDFRLSIERLRFENRQVTSIVGRNGAGKSTFLKCLAGVVPVPKPSLFLDGRDLASLRVGERARLISYVPQELTLALNYSVLDFVLMGRAAFISPFSVPSREDLRTAGEALQFVGLEGFEKRDFSQLSSGERRLVLIARTLHNLDMAVKYSDAMIFMKKGKVVASGKPDEVLNADLLEQVYDIPMAIVPYDGKKIILR